MRNIYKKGIWGSVGIQRKSGRWSREVTDEKWGPEVGGDLVNGEEMTKFVSVPFALHGL